MTKAFNLFFWENEPSVNTPLGETLLNKVNIGLEEIDNRVINMDVTKANQTDLLTAVADVTFDEDTGIFTIIKKSGATTVIDTKLEKLAINFTYDADNQRLVLTLEDGTIQYVDLKELVTELDFLNSNTVIFSVSQGKVTANIAKGSITSDMLEPNYLANIQLYASQALSSANSAKDYASNSASSATLAESYTHGNTGARDGEDTDNAKYYMEQAKNIAGSDIANIIDGTTPVGNALALGGKDASEYANVEKEYLATSIQEKALSLPNGTYFYHLGGSYYTGGDLPSGAWAFGSAMVVKRGPSSIEIVLFTESLSTIAVNAYNGVKWNGWLVNATTADIANYMPLSGGKLSNSQGTVLVVENTDENIPNIRFAGKSGSLGNIGFNGANNPTFWQSNGATSHTLLHTGNMPKGIYTGNGSAYQNVAVGGTGEFVMVSTDGKGTKSDFVIVSQNGYFGKVGGAVVQGNNMYTTSGGALIIDGVTAFLTSGKQYRYQRL